MTAVPSSRIAVFVSSTIGECAPERAAAKAAIEALNYECILFETVGARPHPARVTYLQGLARSQICVVIWKESYGYIDPQAGLNISGIEDEYRRALDYGRDMLLYVKRNTPKRDSRLAALVEEAKPHLTISFYDDDASLGDQIKSDITAIVSQNYIDKFPARAARLIDPAAILGGIAPAQIPFIERPELEAALDASVREHQTSWVVGPPGSGKTVLLAQWAGRRKAAYVNARGVSLLQLLGLIATALAAPASATTPVSMEDAIALLRSAARSNSPWPIVIDDPADLEELIPVLQQALAERDEARVVIAVRSGQEPASAARITIPGFTDVQLASIAQALPPASRAAVERVPARDKHVLPLEVRKAVVTSLGRPGLVFEDIDGVRPDPLTRELLAFIAVSPEPLTLDDLLRLSSGGTENAVAAEAKLRDIDHLIVDDGLGYRPIHDELAADLRAALAARPSLQKFVCQRLGQFFAKRNRHAAAFALFRPFDPERALRSAHRAASQAAVQGRLPQSIPLLEYISEARRAAGQRIDLTISLIALAQAHESVGNARAAATCLEEAEATAKVVGDQVLVQAVHDQRLIARIRRELRPADLEALREIRARYASEGRLEDAGRLACEEGTILLTINAHEKAAAVLREAREIFVKTGDRHGIHVATRNLIATLNMIEDGQAEAEHLLRELEGDDYGFDKLRERAWICNILARRYRYDSRLDERRCCRAGSDRNRPQTWRSLPDCP